MLRSVRGLRRHAGQAPQELIDSLAVFRLTRLLVADSITKEPREAFQEWCLKGQRLKLLELSSCPWCMSIHVAFGVVLARKIAPRAWGPIATALAFSAVAGILSEAT
jgi:hypothetical protein